MKRGPIRRPGRPNKGLTAARRMAGGGYVLYLTPGDLATIRVYAARNGLPGRYALLTEARKHSLEPDEQIPHLAEFRMGMSLDVYEAKRFPLSELQQYARDRGKLLNNCISALIRKAFGPPPSKPTWVRPDVWKLWCEQPLSRYHPEPALETFYEALKDGKLL